uniref:Putative secreted peptide n=1 Tax=Anopheles braziliensis TaxID=58242 RepID=A0A2M3ZVH5_9DIPT
MPQAWMGGGWFLVQQHRPVSTVMQLLLVVVDVAATPHVFLLHRFTPASITNTNSTHTHRHTHGCTTETAMHGTPSIGCWCC